MSEAPTIMTVPAEPFIALRLPPPPSTNDLWMVAGGRIVLTKRYRAWKKEATWEVIAQRRQRRIAGLFSGLLRAPEGMDLDNRIKATLDAAQAGGAIVNDSMCRQLLMEIHPALKDHVLLWLWPVAPT